MDPETRPGEAAFTLLETMVAGAVVAGLMVVALGTLTASDEFVGESLASSEAVLRANRFGELLTRELRGAGAITLAGTASSPTGAFTAVSYRKPVGFDLARAAPTFGVLHQMRFEFDVGEGGAGSGDDGAHTLLAVDVDGCGGIYRATPWVARERWMYSAVAGTAIVTAEGVGVEPAGCTGTVCEERAQSAVGLSADGRRMVLAAADRATPREVGDLLAAHGAWVGMLLDGGPSTAMVVDGEVVNVLSDGVERRVASHLAVFSGRGPRAWDVRGIVRGQPVVDVEIRTFWDQRLDGRATVPAAGGEENDGLFQYMPMPFRNVRIVTADRCLFTGFTGPEDLRLWWAVEEGATCPPAECTRVADAWAVTEPACPGDTSAAAIVPGTPAAAATCGSVSAPALAAAWHLPLILIGIAAALRRRCLPDLPAQRRKGRKGP